MNSNNQKIIIAIDETKYVSWKKCLKTKLEMLKSKDIEIDFKNLDLSCKDISEVISISNQYNCNIIGFCSTSPKTTVSSKSLGYESRFSVKNTSNNVLNNDKNLNILKTHFHEGTVRSGEYLDCSGDLLILGDVNPGAKVSAEGNIIIWGRLLGIAHAGSKGNSQATISALQLRPVQLRIAKKVARGPNEKLQLGIAEQAKIDSDRIIIFPLETT